MASTKVAPVTELTVEEQQIAQLEAQLVVRDERIAELAGYQAASRAAADTIADLEEELSQVAAERDGAVSAAARATAAANDAGSAAAADANTVAAAKALAASIKVLLG